MAQSKRHISFLSLPPEQRNQIYELALVPQQKSQAGVDDSTAIYIGRPITGHRLIGSFGDENERFQLTEWAKQPAITRVSRQLRMETLPMYYGLNEFFTKILNRGLNWAPVPQDNDPIEQWADMDHLFAWLGTMGQANRDLVKRLTVRSARKLGHHWLAKQLDQRRLTVPSACITQLTWVDTDDPSLLWDENVGWVEEGDVEEHVDSGAFRFNRRKTAVVREDNVGGGA